MHHRHFLHLLVASLIAVLACAPVFAAPPTIDTIDVDVTFVNEFYSEACGFDILHHLEGHVTVFEYTHEHNPVDLKMSIHLHGSFTNATTGESVPFVYTATDTYTVQEDGAVTRVRAGLSGMLTIPGQGQVTADVGRIVLSFPADGGTPTVAFVAGIHSDPPWPPSPLPALCDVLAA